MKYIPTAKKCAHDFAKEQSKNKSELILVFYSLINAHTGGQPTVFNNRFV